MAYDGAGCREPDDERTAPPGDVHGGHMPEACRRDEPGTAAGPPDSPQDPPSAAAGRIYCDNGGHV